jgi:hypothetical protein
LPAPPQRTLQVFANQSSTAMLFPTWQQENAVWGKLGESYFAPTRTPNHTITVSNFAITPQV